MWTKTVLMYAWFVFLCYLAQRVTGRDDHHQQHEQEQEQQPNILFILADDFGYDDIGLHTDDIKTPNLDSLFQNGIELTNYYVQATCSPTRGALMTGRYPVHNGLICVILGKQAAGLPLNETIMAQVFHDHNYSTHIVGSVQFNLYPLPFA